MNFIDQIKNNSKQNNIFLLLSLLGVFILWFTTSKHSFFWDTVQLGSKHANFYYSTNFSKLLLPNEIDSGHIPFFGFYIAFIWKLFGRTLFVSHLAILPFALGIIFQIYILVKKFIPKEYIGLTAFLILLDPTLLSQITLVSPDVLLVFFFLLGTNSVLNNKKILLSISILFLFLISMRGMMISVCLLILDFYTNNLLKKNTKEFFNNLIKRSIIYLPALIVFIIYNWHHYTTKGWIGYHENSPWAGSFATVGFKGFLKNIAVLIWRFLDFGRTGIWIVLLYLLILFKDKLFVKIKTKLIFFFALSLLIILPLNMLWAKGLLGHRYLLPIYIIVSLLTAHLLFNNIVNKRLKLILVAVWLLIITTGNLWIYPPKISQGWDATLAHLPYYKLRHQSLNYLDKHNISYNNVATFFPNTASLDIIDLNKDERQLKHFDNTSEYVMYSNIFNVTNKEFQQIKNEYSLLKEYRKKGIFIEIRKKIK